MADEFTGDMTAAVEAAFAASTPDVASTTTTESASPATTEPAVGDVSQAAEPTQTVQEPPGPVPYERFKERNDKANAYEKELESLAWAKGTDPQLAQGAMQLVQRARTNPLAFTEELEAIRDHPVFGPQLRSWAAKTLGTRITGAPAVQSQPAVTEEPQPDLQLQDGTLVYSAAQLQKREGWLMSRISAQMDERIAPLAKTHQATSDYVAKQTLAGLQVQADADAKASIDAIASQPHFADHKKDVLAAMEADDSLSLQQAWAQVFITHVIPKIAQGKAAQQQQKVDASSANPVRPSGAVAAPAKDFHEALTRALGS